MLPPNIIKFIDTLTKKTSLGEVEWLVNDENDSASTNQEKFSLTVKYAFNPDIDSGVYYIAMEDRINNRSYNFLTNQFEDGYQECKWLYENAQASGFNPSAFF